MKKHIVSTLIGAIGLLFTVYAQKPTSTDYDFSNKKVVLPAVVRNLTKEDRYAIQLPGHLSYYGRQEEILNEIWNPFTNFIEIGAKLHQAKYNYKFLIVAQGMTDMRGQGARYIRTELRDANNVPKEANGYVRDFSCRFPCSLVIMNAGDTVLYTIEIASKDEVFTTTMHRDFLFAENKPYYPKPANPYFSEKELMDAETMYHDAVAKKVEQMIAYKVFQRVSATITHLFKDYNTYKQTYGWGFVKTKNRVNDYTDLDQDVLQFKTALDSLENGNFSACKNLCESLASSYNGVLISGDARVDKNVKEILYYNLSHANMLAGHYKQAWDYYRLFIQMGVSEQSRMAMELRGRITLFEFYDKIKSTLTKAG